MAYLLAQRSDESLEDHEADDLFSLLERRLPLDAGRVPAPATSRDDR